MKIPFFISTLFLSIICFAQQSRKSAFYSNQYQSKILNLNTTVPKYEKLEIGIRLPHKINLLLKDSLNPFNPKDVNIEAYFISEKGASKKVHGFYYQDYTRLINSWKPNSTLHNFRIRFAPTETGNYTTYIKTEVAGQTFLDTIQFTCTTSNNKGFIDLGKQGNKTDRYLRFSEKQETFFAVGENMVWPSFQKLKPADMQKQNQWMQELHEAGGNFFRLGLIPDAFGFEWEQLGNYKNRMPQAWELDNVFQTAKELDLYLLLWLDIHGQFTPPSWKGESNSWDNNPYNKHIPLVSKPMDFLTNSNAKDYYKQKLRYIVARWGYSTNLAIIEPLSEIDNFLHEYNSSGKNAREEREAINNWYIEMKDYFVNNLQESRPISLSFTGGEENKIKQKVFRYTDISFLHNYGSQKDVNKHRFSKTKKLFSNKHTQFKPLIFNEVGAEHYATLDNATDNILHNSIWSTALSGHFGCGMTWWWDNAIHPKGWQKNFKGLSEFFKDENLINPNYTPYFYQSNSFSFTKSDIEMYYLKSKDKTKVIGWIHNNSSWWWNYQNENSEIKKLLDNSKPKKDKSDKNNYSDKTRISNKDNGNVTSMSLKSRTIKIKGLKKGVYKIDFYSTTTGTIFHSETLTGNKFLVPDSKIPMTDYGFKITLVQ